MTLGHRLRAIRESRGWSQEDVARKLHVSVALIGRYERNERMPPLDKLMLLADLYDANIADLIGRDDTENKFECSDSTPDQRLRQLGIYLRGCGATEQDLEVIMNLMRERMQETERIKEAHRRIDDIRRQINDAE